MVVTRFDLVIFDCDGVLIDSERLAVATEVVILRELGWPLSEDEIIERFVGRSAAFMQAAVEQKIGRPVNWEREFGDYHRAAFERDLQPVEGVVDVLANLDVATCVASSGTHDTLAFTLGLTGLYAQFEGRIFSASEVEHGKPAPDLFLHAARSLRVAPERCAVIEDSVAGVTAALAAGMSVFAFAGGVTRAAALANDGVTVFSSMSDLPGLLNG
jgi:HAD superfamily hydrolase (TIGR01509 family)